MTNLALNLTEAASMYPGATALRCDDLALSFAELDDAAARFAALLDAEGSEPGDRIGIMLPNTPAFAIAYYGILRMGGIVVPMNPLLAEREVRFQLTNTGARALFALPQCAEAAHGGAAAAGAKCWLVDDASLAELTAGLAPQPRPLSRSADDTAVILHTSGTTGTPKGAELTHGNLGRNQAVTARRLLRLGPGDVVMGCLPLFHVFGMTCGLNTAVASGAALTLLPRFDARKALEIIARDRVTVFEGVPTMYTAMLHAAAEFPAEQTASLRTCISGGAALPVQVLHGFESAFGCAILEGYGLSESSPVACFNHPDRERKPGSIGVPIDGVQMRVVDDTGAEVAPGEVGEIQIRGHNVMKGYWQLPDATAATITDGWLSTGDLGRTDEDGYFYVVDRKKELIIRGGYNVYPREIEEVLYEHPAVAEAAVIGIADDYHGEEVGAAVALKDGATATAEELRAFVKQRVAAYKYPRRVWLVDALPKGPTGKILRREVRAPRLEEDPS
ncbi:long-chain-fatty-acid--CoA ligase [Rhodococcus daqingensis]|uniref:Long-chain fatty acid--CoA ligase n=1 Tax=Rhodococcus daqingensis TaxID=2479363 RepID=A0ABW2S0D9_9NOCA